VVRNLVEMVAHFQSQAHAQNLRSDAAALRLAAEEPLSTHATVPPPLPAAPVEIPLAVGGWWSVLHAEIITKCEEGEDKDAVVHLDTRTLPPATGDPAAGAFLPECLTAAEAVAWRRVLGRLLATAADPAKFSGATQKSQV
jgi:hypothetical protein